MQPPHFTVPISLTIYEKNPLIALKVEVTDPENYFQAHFAEMIKQIAEFKINERENTLRAK